MKSKSSSDNTGLPFTQPMMVTSKVRSSSTCNKQEGNLQTWHNSLKTFLLLVCCRKTKSTWCLKITEKVAFNTKNGPFWQLPKPKACGQTVLPDRSLGQKLMENAKIEMRHF